MNAFNQLKLAKNISFTELDGEAVLLDLNSGAYFGLNHVGVMLINLLEKNTPVSAAIDVIAEKYQVPTSKTQQDIQELVVNMIDQGLLEEHVA